MIIGRGGGDLPTDIRMPDCPDMDCGLIIGEVSTIEIDFVVARGATSMTAVVRAFMGIIEIPYDLPPEAADGCSNLIAGACPVTAGEEVSYRLQMAVDAPINNIPVTIEGSMYDETNTLIACFSMDTTIGTP